MGLNEPHDVLATARAAVRELNRRKLIASAALTVERTRKLVQASREVLDTERKLLADWRARRTGQHARLAQGRRFPRGASFELPKAA